MAALPAELQLPAHWALQPLRREGAFVLLPEGSILGAVLQDSPEQYESQEVEHLLHHIPPSLELDGEALQPESQALSEVSISATQGTEAPCRNQAPSPGPSESMTFDEATPIMSHYALETLNTPAPGLLLTLPPTGGDASPSATVAALDSSPLPVELRLNPGSKRKRGDEEAEDLEARPDASPVQQPLSLEPTYHKKTRQSARDEKGHLLPPLPSIHTMPTRSHSKATPAPAGQAEVRVGQPSTFTQGRQARRKD